MKKYSYLVNNEEYYYIYRMKMYIEQNLTIQVDSGNIHINMYVYQRSASRLYSCSAFVFGLCQWSTTDECDVWNVMDAYDTTIYCIKNQHTSDYELNAELNKKNSNCDPAINDMENQLNFIFIILILSLKWYTFHQSHIKQNL